MSSVSGTIGRIRLRVKGAFIRSIFVDIDLGSSGGIFASGGDGAWDIT